MKGTDGNLTIAKKAYETMFFNSFIGGIDCYETVSSNERSIEQSGKQKPFEITLKEQW